MDNEIRIRTHKFKYNNGVYIRCSDITDRYHVNIEEWLNDRNNFGSTLLCSFSKDERCIPKVFIPNDKEYKKYIDKVYPSGLYAVSAIPEDTCICNGPFIKIAFGSCDFTSLIYATISGTVPVSILRTIDISKLLGISMSKVENILKKYDLFEMYEKSFVPCSLSRIKISDTQIDRFYFMLSASEISTAIIGYDFISGANINVKSRYISDTVVNNIPQRYAADDFKRFVGNKEAIDLDTLVR